MLKDKIQFLILGLPAGMKNHQSFLCLSVVTSERQPLNPAQGCLGICRQEILTTKEEIERSQ